jgi:hypothetical protein
MWLLLSLACRESAQAPAEISELTRFLAVELDNPEPEVMRAAVEQLYLQLEPIDMDGSLVDERSCLLEGFSESELSGLDRPERSPGATLNIGIVGAEAHPIDDHADYMMWADQTPLNSGIEYYTREFPEAEDGDCFVDGSCERILTFNHAVRKNAVYEVYYESHKVWRWITLEDGRRGVVGFAWFSESWPTTSGHEGHLWQSYEVDVWLEVPEGVWRYYAGYSESDIVDGEDLVLGTVRSATQTRYETEEEAAGGQL